MENEPQKNYLSGDKKKSRISTITLFQWIKGETMKQGMDAVS